MTNDDFDAIYTARILELAADIPRLGRLAAPDASASVRSPICGSKVTIDLRLSDGRVADFAHDVRACALGQAASSLMARHIVGAAPEALIALPPGAWRYGRVIAVAESPLASRKDRVKVRRNVEAAIQQLNDLGIVVEEWPSR